MMMKGQDEPADNERLEELRALATAWRGNPKASPWIVQHWMDLSLTLDGRDKITKLLQYASRLIVWLVGGTLGRRFSLLQSNLSHSRKAFRLGRSLVEMEKLRRMSLFATLMMHINNNNNSSSSSSSNKPPLWKTLGNLVKTLGMIGFWAGDNINFLTKSECLDDLEEGNQEERVSLRKALQSSVSKFANRSYFLSCVAGLLVNLKTYWSHRQEKLLPARAKLVNMLTTTNQGIVEAGENLKRLQTQDFILLLAVVKSCCDVLVFANTPGLDLFVRFRGKRMSEVAHCVLAMISASTVLYKNFPNQPDS